MGMSKAENTRQKMLLDSMQMRRNQSPKSLKYLEYVTEQSINACGEIISILTGRDGTMRSKVVLSTPRKTWECSRK